MGMNTKHLKRWHVWLCLSRTTISNPVFVALNLSCVCAGSARLNICVTVGLVKEFPSYYFWNLVLAKSTFSWLSTTDAFLSLSKYLEVSCEEHNEFVQCYREAKRIFFFFCPLKDENIVNSHQKIFANMCLLLCPWVSLCSVLLFSTSLLVTWLFQLTVRDGKTNLKSVTIWCELLTVQGSSIMGIIA